MPQPDPRQLLSDLQRDLRQRWRSGDRRRVEDYLAEHPSLRDEPELLLELIRAEIEAEYESGQSVDLASYLRRFPELAPQLCQTELPAFNAADTHSLRAANPDSTTPHSPATGGDGGYSGPASFSAGRFEIIRAHARGGLGEVFLAADLELNREVALKQIQARLADYSDSRARFVLEAEITGMLEHPGIVPVYSLGVYPNGNPFYAMRFIRGESLKDAIRRFHAGQASSLPPDARQAESPSYESIEFRKLLTRFVSVCHAIAYAHSRGVLHRDLKPDNIMLGDYGETLVVDWGLAKCSRHAPRDETRADVAETSLPPIVPRTFTDAAASVQGQVIGTPAFMPPEQAEGKLDELTAAADIYSLGATLCMLLTGQPPFKGKNTDEVLTQVRSGNITQPATLASGVPRALQAICLKAMSKTPTDRYPSARLLAEDIDKWLADEPVAAYREPFSVRARRWGRKHRTVVASATVGVAIVLIALAGALGLTARHNVQLAAEQQKTEVANRELRISNEQERLAKEQTQRRLKQIEKGVDLFAGLTHGINPRNEGIGGEKAVYEMLAERAERAADELDADAVGDQHAVARLQTILGDSLTELGREDKAIEVLQKAVATLEHELGANNWETLAARTSLAKACLAAKQVPRAIHLLERVRDQRAIDLGRDDPATLGTLDDLAAAYYAANDLGRAIQLFEQVADAQTRKLGPDDDQTVNTRMNLAAAYLQNRNLQQAIELLEKGRDIRIRTKGPDHVDTLTTMSTLASAYQHIGDSRRAIALYQQVHDSQAKKLGADHPSALTTLQNLAAAHKEIGSFALAIELLKEIRDRRAERLGPDHPTTLQSVAKLGNAYAEAGELLQAITVLEQARNTQIEKLGADHPDTLLTLNYLASAYRDAGRISEAVEMLEQARNASLKTVGADNPRTHDVLNSLAGAYFAAGRYAEAIEIYERVRTVFAERLGPDEPDSLVLLNNLATAHDALGNSSAGLQIHERLREINTNKLGSDHPSTLNALNNLATAYQSAGKLTEAIDLLEQVRDARIKKFGADHPDTLNALANLAVGYEAAGRLGPAIEILEQVRSRQTKQLGDHHPNTLKTAANLASAYGEAGKSELAVRMLEPLRDVVLREFGTDHPDTLAILNKLAAAYVEVGNLQQAIPMLERVHKTQARQLGEDHPKTLQTLNNLATAFHTSNDMPRAIELFERVSDAQVRTLGGDHPSTLTTLSNLAAAHLWLRNAKPAIEILERVSEAETRKLGADHPGTLNTLNTLAAAYKQAGKVSRAIELSEQVRDAQTKKLGADHPSTITTISNLAQAYQAAGNHELAIEMLKQVRDDRSKKLGADHPATLVALQNLASAHSNAGDLPGAINVYAQVARGIEKGGFQHPYAEGMLHHVCEAYETDQQFEIAETWRRKWAAVCKAKAGPESTKYVTALQLLGRNLIQQRKWPEAENSIREGLSIREKLVPQGSSALDTQLGVVLLGQKRYEEAEAQLLKIYMALKTAENPVSDDAGMAEVLRWLSELYMALDKPEETQKYLRECLAVREKLQPEDWSLFHTKSLLGAALARQKEFEDAEPLLIEGYEGMKAREDKIPAAAKARLTEALQRLVDLYTAWEKPEEAAKWKAVLEAATSASKE